MNENVRLLLVGEVANRLRVTPSTVYRLIEDGSLEAIRVGRGKGALRVLGPSYDDYFERCKQAAKSA